jgi:hypothetical protein
MTTQSDLDAQQREWDAANQEIDSQDIKLAGVSDTLKAIGSKILGKGSSSKNDASGNERAYRVHVEEMKNMGEKPPTREEFDKANGAGIVKS